MMNADSHENFFPFEDPGVLISVHSPFVPVNPFEEGTFLRPGYRYEIFIEMEQERLLPYPYQTDCIDYDVRFQTNNKTGPRSQRQCLDRCWSNYSKQMYGCEDSLTIYETLDTKCKEGSSSKLQCEGENKRLFIRDDTIRLEVYVRNPEVMVLSHNPLYVSVELFGYIGGLMGCWLGISVWAFIDILEGPIWSLIKFLRKKTRSNEK
ncbi:uncharacterized protein NPIL_442281 [Nephila pilipes]|uniref:Uncharacterized protein n=1 Tax=Nephila pilipes TaxID=299642 RepID=A0A8X6NJ85_NEPPI|nr:uncharacterized protein NPIL_442281 [Nephila pilipes]